MSSLPPLLLLHPIYKEKIWGGRKLAVEMGRSIPEGPIGESWEVSVYDKDLSPLVEPILSYQNLRDLCKAYPKEVLGIPFVDGELPLLVKVIDAKEKLSVQVHPDDAYALAKDPKNHGKKECWYVLSADPGAELVVGFKVDTTKEEFQSYVESNNCESLLKSWPVQPGDVFLLEPGTIHAIGGGVVLLEVQQSSDSTYRVYDYGRLGDDGRPRELHLQKALDVLKFKASTGSEKQTKKLLTYHPFPRFLYTSNDKFRLELWEFPQSQGLFFTSLSVPSTFGIFYTISGEVRFPHLQKKVSAGESFFLTAEGFSKDLSAFVEQGTKLAFMSAGTDMVKYQ